MSETASRPRVLIADDEQVIAGTLATILNHGGFEARDVNTSADALRVAPDFAPDVLITDVIMAGLDGIDLAIRIKALLPGVRVFLLSGQTATADLLQRRNATGHGFEILQKPVHPRDLISRLRESLAA
jgi:DNA-binding response OmpR family regulator